MATKELLLSHHAHIAVLRGVTALSRAVKATLGPGGRHAMLQQQWGAPLITKDGVTVANDIELVDRFENMGAQLVREAARKTIESAGDGTTTAIVLAEAIFREGVKNVTAGASPMAVKRGIDRAVEVVIAALHDRSQPCKSRESIEQVATVAANNDPAIGAIIADAMIGVGRDGAVTVEDSANLRTELEVVEGLQFDRGYLSPDFVTDPEHMEVVLERPGILLSDARIGTLHDLLPLLEQAREAGSSLLIVADDVRNEVLATLIMNVRQGNLQVAAVKAPGLGEHRHELLEDLAVVTGGKAVLHDLGLALRQVQLAELGSARRVTVRHDRTTVVGGAGDASSVVARMAQIRARLAETASSSERNKLQERLAKLANGIAVIRVGAATEVELKANKARIEDALHAARAAVEEGIVPGGGVTLVRCIPALDGLTFPGDEQVGVDIVRRALESPLRQIADNAGYAGTVVLSRVRQQGETVGFDAASGAYVDMFMAGIVDPTKVTRSALCHAASVAGLMLTTDVLVKESPGDNEPADAAPFSLAHSS